MKKFHPNIMLFVVALLFAMRPPELSSQTREPNPPDSAKAAGQKLSPDAEKSRLELPDVLIYGTDRSVRMTGEKVVSQPPDVKLIAPVAEYQSLAGEHNDDARKNYFQASQAAGSQTTLQLSAGRFSQLGMIARRHHASKNYNYSVQGNFQRSNGQFQNSHYSEGALKAQAGMNISPEFSSSGNTNCQFYDYGLYGAIAEELTRQTSIAKFKIDTQWLPAPNRAFDFSMNYHRQRYLDRDTSDFRSELAERNISLSSGFHTKICAIPVAILGQYHYSRLAPDDMTIMSQQYVQLKSSLSMTIKNYVTVKPAVMFENLALKPSFSNNLISPALEIVATPGKKAGVMLQISRGFSPLTYAHSWEMNQFISQRFQFIPSQKELEAKFGIELNPIPPVTIRGIVIHQKWDQYGYWMRESESGLFALHALTDVALTTCSLHNSIALLPNLKLDAGIQLAWDTIHGDSTIGNEPHTPYLERFRLPVTLGYQFDRTTVARLSFHWIGARYASLYDDTQLSAFGLVQVNIEKQLHKHFSIYLSGDNLLNQDYQLWQNFPGMKLYLEIGMQGNW